MAGEELLERVDVEPVVVDRDRRAPGRRQLRIAAGTPAKLGDSQAIEVAGTG